MPHHTLMPKSVCINQETDRTFHDKWQLRALHKWRQKILGRKRSKIQTKSIRSKIKVKILMGSIKWCCKRGRGHCSGGKKWRHLWMAPRVLNTLPPVICQLTGHEKKFFFFFFAFSHKTIIMLPSLHWCSFLGCFNIFMTASKKLLLLAQNY